MTSTKSTPIVNRVTKTEGIQTQKAFLILFRTSEGVMDRPLSCTFVGEPRPTAYEVLDAFLALGVPLLQDQKRRILAGQFRIEETVAVTRRSK